MKQILLAIIYLITTSAYALDVPMMEVQSDIDGDEVAHIALQVSASTRIESVLYQNYPNTPYRNFSIEDLNKDKETIVKKGPAKIVEIATETISKNSIYFFIHYIHEYKLVGSDKRVKTLKMYYVSPTNLWETQDTDTKKVVTKAFFYVNEVNGKQKGIDRIETW